MATPQGETQTLSGDQRYRALLAVSEAIVSHRDLSALFHALADRLHDVVRFDHFALILHDRPMGGQAGWGWIASAISLVSITLGTLYQRRYCSRIDWRSGNLVQYVAVTVFFTIGAFLFEQRVVHWTTEFILALAWLAVALSIGSIGLLYWLIRHQAATSVASLFYLVPAVTSLMAFVLFDERLDAVAIAGMIACAAAVLLVNRKAPAKS